MNTINNTRQTLQNVTAKYSKAIALLPYVAFYIILFVFHLQMNNNCSDDIVAKSILPSNMIWQTMVLRYETWSARTLIDLILWLIAGLPFIVWQIVNPAIISFSAWACVRILNDKNSFTSAMVACSLLFCYSWFDLSSAGWVTTMMVFAWPLAAALFALIPVSDILRGRKPKKAVCILSVIAMVYACNMEQLTVVIAIILIACIAFLLVKKQKIYAIIFAQLGAVIANFIYMGIICPGNFNRFESEVVARYKNFAMQSLLTKVESGVSMTLQTAFFSLNVVTAIFVLLLCAVICTRYKNFVYKTFCVSFFVVCLVVGLFKYQFIEFVPALEKLVNLNLGASLINISNVNSISAYIPFLVLCSLFAMCFLCIYLAFGHTLKSLFASVLFFAGFCSNASIGFSPTIGASGSRTAFFFAYCMIVISFMLYNEIKNNKVRLVIHVVLVLAIVRQIFYFIEGLKFPPYV